MFDEKGAVGPAFAEIAGPRFHVIAFNVGLNVNEDLMNNVMRFTAPQSMSSNGSLRLSCDSRPHTSAAEGPTRSMWTVTVCLDAAMALLREECFLRLLDFRRRQILDVRASDQL